MGYSVAGFICAFLMAFSPQTCRAQSSVVMWQVNRMANEIDEIVTGAKEDAVTYVTELKKLLENLNTTATSNLTEILSATNNLTTSVQSVVTSLIADSNETDVHKCAELATPLLLAIADIEDEVSLCINREVSQAENEVGLTIPYVDSQLDSIQSLQLLAQHCLARYNESSQGSADANQAFACVWPIHRSAELAILRFKFIVDISLAESLFNGYKNRVATCGSIATSALGSLTDSTQTIYEKSESCVAGTSS